MKHKKENGEVVVEASIVVTIVVIFISVMFYIGMILYQQSLVSIIANRTASDIAQVYSNNLKDPFTGYVDSDRVYQSITYSNMKTDAYADVIAQKAHSLGLYRMKSSAILNTGETTVEVQLVKKQNELLKSQIIVTVHDKYELPLVSIFGVDNKLTFSASGRADCVDILEYINGVEAIGDPENSSITYLPDSDTCLIQFYDNNVDNNLVATVPVLKGKSIISSNYYTHSTMPKNPMSDKFEFAGWFQEDGLAFFATTEIHSNIVVYGSWKCTVKFEPEGGTVSPASKKVTVWSATELPTPSRSGYTFLGWFTEKNGVGTQYYSNATIINDNITLYAHWQCNHNYAMDSYTPGNCRTPEHMVYKCVQCGDIYETDGNLGGHNYQWVGSGGYWCYEGYHIYRCSLCGDQYNSPAPGIGTVHNFTARCNVPHYCKKGTFYCTTAGWNSITNRYNTCNTTTKYHLTCEYCGAIKRDWSTPWGTQKYWCGTHGAGGKPITGCGYGGSKK